MSDATSLAIAGLVAEKHRLVEEIERLRAALTQMAVTLEEDSGDEWIEELAEYARAALAGGAEDTAPELTIGELRAEYERLTRERDEWADIAPPELGTPGLFGMYVDALHKRVEDAEAENERLRAAITEAVDVIDGLAEQQSMRDTWYEEPKARFVALAGGAGDTAA